MAVEDLSIKKIVVCTVSTIVGALLITSLATLYKTGGEKIFPGIYWNMREETADRIKKEAEDRFNDADKMLRNALTNRETINNELESLNRQVVEAGDDLDKKIESQHDLQSQRAQADTEYAEIKKLHDKAKKELEQANEQWRKVREKNKPRSTVEVTDEYDDEEVVIITDDTTKGGDKDAQPVEEKHEDAQPVEEKHEDAQPVEEKHEDAQPVEEKHEDDTTTTTTTEQPVVEGAQPAADATEGGDKDAQPVEEKHEDDTVTTTTTEKK